MTRGTMEVIVVGARDLKNSDLFGNINPYVVIKYNNQEQKTTIGQPNTSRSQIRRCLFLRGQDGRRPIWNEKFIFKVEYPVPGARNQQPKLLLNIMDYDTFNNDDDLGQATIYLKEFFELGLEKGHAELLPHRYRVVADDKTYQGEIEVGLIFTVNGKDDQKKYGSGRKRKLGQS